MTGSRSLAGLLLAGGGSTRMGRPKALLPFADQPLWRVQADKLRSLQPADLFISIPRELVLPAGPWQFLHDRVSGLGPLAGIHAAFKAMTADWLVVLAIDLPDMSPVFLRELCDAAWTCGSGAVPRRDGCYEGLAAVYPRSMMDLCGRHLLGTDRSMQNFVKAGVAQGFLRDYAVTDENRSLFRNVNQPSDLEGPDRGPNRD